MKYFKFAVSSILVMALIMMFIGCAKPPEAEKAAAKTAMDAAVTAGADKYAPADFKTAKGAWDASEGQMNDKKYDEAKQGYLAAKAAFDKAGAAAAAGKKAVSDEANAAIAALEDGWKNLADAAKGVEKKMKDKQEAWAADTKVFEDGLKATKDMVAGDPAGAKKKAAELKAIIDKWDASFKELAAIPDKPAKKGKK
jgi:hypothetical protein